MEKLKRIVCSAAIAVAVGTTTAHAQDTAALLDLLVKKKIVTQKEADALRTEAAKEQKRSASALKRAAPAEVSVNSADKWKLSAPLTQIELYGDARVRYESRWGETGAPNALDPRHDTLQRSRERYRLRIGLRGTLTDDWFFGLRLETSTNPRSTNVTFGDDTATGPGPFAKNSDSINVGQAYIGYKGFKEITLTAGKMPNPFVTTSMVWDPDINPEGLAEQWKHTFKFGGETARAPANYSKDNKNIAPVQTSGTSGMSLDVFANLGQFVYDDSNPENPIGPAPRGIPNTDAFLLGWQVGAKLSFDKNTFVQIAPTLYNYLRAFGFGRPSALRS